MKIEEIRKSILESKYRISDHAVDEMSEENLGLANVLYSVENGEIIEDYPESRKAPSCLILGKDFDYNSIHSVWGYFKDTSYSVLITVYKPNKKEWMDDQKTRRVK